MKTLCAFLLIAVTAHAATNQVSFDLGIFSAESVAYKQVRIAPSRSSFPRAEGTRVVGVDYGFRTTDANGLFTNAMVTGTYDITFTNRFLATTFQITVPSTNYSGILTAAELTTTGTNSPSNLAAYSQAAANARFVEKDAGKGTNNTLTYPKFLGGTMTVAYVWTLTNAATGGGHWAASSGGGGITGILLDNGGATILLDNQ
jgi:hypothetical protein